MQRKENKNRKINLLFDATYLVLISQQSDNK